MKEKVKAKDPTNPSYYEDYKYSCIQVIEDLYKHSTNDGYVDYNRFQAFKYLWRLGNKDDTLQDMKKAVVYMNFAISYLENKK